MGYFFAGVSAANAAVTNKSAAQTEIPAVLLFIPVTYGCSAMTSILGFPDFAPEFDALK